MKMDENVKRRRLSSSPPNFKVEVKEENLLGNDYLMAKGRLQGVLRQLTEQSESESEETEDENDYQRNKKNIESGRKKKAAIAPVRSTYLMKLYDRSVDLARFEEDTPLYPICRAWIANNNKNPQRIVKRRLSSPEPESEWNSVVIQDVHRLPPPTGTFISRIPSPTLEQMQKSRENMDEVIQDKAQFSKDQLMGEYIDRWRSIKKKWIFTALKNEDRYTMSKNVLQAIYTKAQEGMLGE